MADCREASGTGKVQRDDGWADKIWGCCVYTASGVKSFCL